MPSAGPPDDPPDRAPVPIVPVHVCVWYDSVRMFGAWVCVCVCVRVRLWELEGVCPRLFNRWGLRMSLFVCVRVMESIRALIVCPRACVVGVTVAIIAFRGLPKPLR